MYGATETHEAGLPPAPAPVECKVKFIAWPAVVGLALLGWAASHGSNLTNGALNLVRAPAKHSASSQNTPPSMVSFTTWNEYTENHSLAFSQYKWEHIVEPYRETTLVAQYHGNVSELQWHVDGYWIYTGDTAQHTFKSLGYHRVSLVAFGGGPPQNYTQDVMCKYVRRELRSLHAPDRMNFFDALETLYFTPTQEGILKYGPAYKGIEWFVREHLRGAAARDCDHWHDGAGLMVHHLSISLLLEESLQVVDKSVALPYWSYTLDQSQFQGRWRERSIIFSDDWFGPASSPGKVISKGRWAYTPVMQHAASYSDITNGYGMLRAPWNQNPSPFLSRYQYVFETESFSDLVTCGNLASCFKSGSIAKLNFCMNGGTHGPLHVMIGGVWGQRETQERVERFLALTNGTHAHDLLQLSKIMWRHGFAVSPRRCDPQSSSSSCTVQCPDEIMKGFSSYAVLTNETGILHWIDQFSDRIFFDQSDGLYHIKNYSPEEERDAWDDLVKVVCNPGHVGDVFTSAAPNDPIFWVIHTEQERFLQWRRIASAKGLRYLDETWGYEHWASPTTPASDTGVVCDWTASQESQLPTCHPGRCSGHTPYDRLNFGNFSHYGLDEHPTNEAFYEFLDPYNDKLPYAYDSFDWDHCEQQGFDVV